MLAPEVLTGSEADLKAADWWAFGILLYMFLTNGKLPWSTAPSQHLIDFPTDLSDSAKDLLSQLLLPDPQQRLTHVPTIKDHPYFAGIDWDLVASGKVTNMSAISPDNPVCRR